MAQGNISECTPNTVLNNCPSHYTVVDDTTEIQLDGTQFCRAFFHVPKVLNWNIEMQCLDEENCMVIDQTKPDPPLSQPRYVVCLVELKRGDDVEYMAMYENCVKEGQEKHAEEFFDEDARNGTLGQILDELQDSDLSSRFAGMKLEGLKLYMYITLQPCHNSANLTPDKSCTEVLIDLYKDILQPLHIEFIVKPTFILKAYWSLSNNDELNQQIEKAKEGLKLLHEEGIQIEAMEEEDWTYLRNQLCPSAELFPRSSYEQSQRKKLDGRIREFLLEEGFSTRTSSTSGSDSNSSSGSD